MPDGSWRYPNRRAKLASPLQDYDQLETYRRLGQLVEKCALDSASSAVRRAAEFLFTKQTSGGDFRGIYGVQYTPNYTAAITELLVKAGYSEDHRTARAFAWLLSNRQDDGGWAIPFRTAASHFPGRVTHSAITSTSTVERVASMPSSHMVTGIVLRAFAAHERLRSHPAARSAADSFLPRLFKRDSYVDRGAPEFWERVTFPFWFTDIVSALDTLSTLGGGPMRGKEIEAALSWLASRQTGAGTFDLKLLKTGDPSPEHWEALAVSRVFRRYA